MQSKPPIFEDLSQLLTGAAELAQGVGSETKALFYSRVEKGIAEMDLVRREELNNLREILVAAIEKIEAQNLEIRKLKQKIDKN